MMYRNPFDGVVRKMDFSQIEMQCAAFRAGDKVYIDTETTGLSPTRVDLHTEYASKKFGVPQENVTPAMRAMVKNELFFHLYGGSGVMNR